MSFGFRALGLVGRAVELLEYLLAAAVGHAQAAIQNLDLDAGGEALERGRWPIRIRSKIRIRTQRQRRRSCLAAPDALVEESQPLHLLNVK